MRILISLGFEPHKAPSYGNHLSETANPTDLDKIVAIPKITLSLISKGAWSFIALICYHKNISRMYVDIALPINKLTSALIAFTGPNKSSRT